MLPGRDEEAEDEHEEVHRRARVEDDAVHLNFSLSSSRSFVDESLTMGTRAAR